MYLFCLKKRFWVSAMVSIWTFVDFSEIKLHFVGTYTPLLILNLVACWIVVRHTFLKNLHSVLDSHCCWFDKKIVQDSASLLMPNHLVVAT
jgi:hypothetical protein